jgi:hypothetical protein
MLLQVIDGQGLLTTVIAASQETVVDHSGSITGSGSQALLAVNPTRSGWFVQNRGTNPMYINELGAAASAAVSAGSGSVMIPAGASFPPAGYPLTSQAINILGTLADNFVCREW